MATKPASEPRWSDVDPGTTTVEPSSGLKDDGWVALDRPAARHLNWLFYWIYQSIVYVSASFRTDGAGVRYVDRSLPIHAADFDAAMGTSSSDSWVFAPSISTAGGAASFWLTSAEDVVAEATLPVAIGDRLKEVSAYVKDTLTTGAMTLQVWKTLMSSGTKTQVGATVTSDASGNRQKLSRTGLTEVAAAGYTYSVTVKSSAGTATNERVEGGELVTDCIT